MVTRVSRNRPGSLTVTVFPSAYFIEHLPFLCKQNLTDVCFCNINTHLLLPKIHERSLRSMYSLLLLNSFINTTNNLHPTLNRSNSNKWESSKAVESKHVKFLGVHLCVEIFF